MTVIKLIRQLEKLQWDAEVQIEIYDSFQDEYRVFSIRKVEQSSSRNVYIEG